MSGAAPLLALDIGTRKVAGVVAEPAGRGLRVVAARVLEHADRSMLDGQVHKIEAVAEVVARVRSELEADTGHTFREAAVAAAGRALLTESATQHRHFPQDTEITRDLVRQLEFAAAREAQTILAGKDRRRQLHCVGFSPVRYALDGNAMDELAGHRGRELEATVLSTFLPRLVVDSLLTVLRRAGLAVSSLTLEPIAAIEATIPPDLRRMNLALVDIGAGTSDIALTRQGSVFAYAMVTQAGDEITERLCDHFLLDFHEGERVKRLLAQAHGSIVLTTLLGQRREVDAEEIRRAIEPDVDQLARAIGESIAELNGGAPRAVILVGGGSATPGLGPALARVLDLDEQRIGVRTPDLNPDVLNDTGRLTGVDGITPLGIALSALRGQGLGFQRARVNGEPVQMLAFQSAPTVFDALLAAGVDSRRLYPRPGAALTYTLDGALRTVPGTLGEPARLTVEGRAATLDTELASDAAVEVTPGRDGEPGVLLPEQLTSPAPAGFWLNGERRDLEWVLRNDGRPVDMGEPLPDRANLEWTSRLTLADYLPALKLAASRMLTVKVNGEPRRIPVAAPHAQANGAPVDGAYRPRPDDRIEFHPAPAPAVRLQEVVGELAPSSRIRVVVNGQPRVLDTGGSRILVNGRAVQPDEPLADRAEIIVEHRPGEPPLLSHVLEGLNLKPPKDAGPLRLRVDGEEASFVTPLRDGSRVDISFG